MTSTKVSPEVEVIVHKTVERPMSTRRRVVVGAVLVVQSLIVLFIAAPPLIRAIFRLPTREAQ